jgi:hypothetical protein
MCLLKRDINMHTTCRMYSYKNLQCNIIQNTNLVIPIIILLSYSVNIFRTYTRDDVTPSSPPVTVTNTLRA